MHEDTELAFAGDAEGARRVSRSLDPVRRALEGTRPRDRPQAHQKYWQELPGHAGGPPTPAQECASSLW